MFEKYESTQKRIRRPASQIYAVLSDFNNFTPLAEGRIDGWAVNSEGDRCMFTLKGMSVGLRMVDRVPDNLIKIEALDSSPFGFTFWVQLKEIAPSDTRMRLVLHAEMNMMIKMIVGRKLATGIEQLADYIASAFS